MRVVVSGDHLFVACDPGGLQVMNISDPSHAYVVGFYNTPYGALGVAASGNYAYVADRYSFEIFDCSEALPVVEYEASESPSVFRLLPNYPNPFDSTTVIPFEISTPGSVTLSVWNILGQKVATLLNQPLPVGPHQIIWDAGTLPSSVYFIHLQTNNYHATQKIILQK